MKTYFLSGKRIALREILDADIDKWHPWFNDSEITFYMDQGRFPNSFQKQVAYLKKMSKSKTDLQLSIVHKKTGELIGTAGIHQIDHINSNADISLLIGEKKYWGKGAGKEVAELLVKHAFKNLNLHKLTAGMSEENVGSYKVFESVGFKKEGLLRDQLFKNGKYRNIIKMGLINQKRKG